MTSTLGYAILGLLAREPRTGYEVSRALDHPVGYFWTARHSQIYPELARLETSGMVRHRVVAGPGPRANKRYSLTAKGRRELRSWVTTPPAPEPSRSELLLRAYSIWLVDPGAAATMIRGEREKHAAQLAGYLKMTKSVDEPSVDSPRFGNYATLRAGIGYERHVLRWLDWLHDRLCEATPEPAAAPESETT